MTLHWLPDDDEERGPYQLKIRSVAKKGGKARQRQLRDFLDRHPQVFVDALNVLHNTFGSSPFSTETVRALSSKKHFALEDPFTPAAATGKVIKDRRGASRPEPRAMVTLWVAVNAIKEAVHQIIKQKNPRSKCVRHIITPTIHRVRDVQMGFEAKKHQVMLRANPGVDAFDLGTKGGLDARSLQLAIPLEVSAGYCGFVTGILENFLGLSADYLRRLRRCKWPKCRNPYFVDRAAGARAAYCRGSNHRIKHWRETHPKQRQRP
jgi:hypothetical protein